MMDPLTTMPGDFLVCGGCHMNFKLSSMQDFIQHKLFDCQGIPQKAMECQSCPDKFHTPWSLLQHAQNAHSLKIFLQHGSYSPGIADVLINKSSYGKSDEISLETSSSHTGAPQKPTQAHTDVQMPNRSQERPAVAVQRALSLPPNTYAIVNSASSLKTASDPKTTPSQTFSCKCTMLANTALTVEPNTATAPATTGLQCTCNFTNSPVGARSVVTAAPVVAMPLAAPPITATPTVTAPPMKVPHVTAPLLTVPPVTAPRQTAPLVTVTPVTAPPKTAPPVEPSSTVPLVKAVIPPTTGVTDIILQHLPSLVQGADKAQQILLGKHPISVLPTIRLPQGTVLGTAVAVGKSPLTRMPFTTVPFVDATQIKTSLTAPKELVSIQKAICVNQSPGIATTLVESHLMSTSIVSKPAKSQVFSEKDDTKVHEKCSLQMKPASLTPVLNSPETTSNRSLVLQKSQVPVSDSSPKSIQTNSTSDMKSSVSTKDKEEGDMSAEQPQMCVCLCCKAGTCCVRGQAVTTETDNVIDRLNEAQNLEGSEEQQGRIHCCDASVQADHAEFPDKIGERKRNKNLKQSENPEKSDDTDKNSDDAIRCCDNQDCGVTIMPGTHEGLKKCCNAVVPKKRKRHMETKHRIKKRAVAPSFSMPEENTIYIDFQAGSDIPHVSSATGVTLSGADSLGTITLNTSDANSQQMVQNIENQRSLTLSFPVSYTRKTSCLPGNCRQGQECSCGCCPPKFPSNRDKRSKSVRRLSTSSNDAKKELTTGRTVAASTATGQANSDLALGVKDESLMNAVDSSEEATQNNISGTRKLARPLRPGVGKKRRYPTSRPFKCDKCDHAFNQRIHLKKHQSKHTGVKPFKCEQCDYSTVERSHLKVHIRVHTGEKPYKCSHCEYATAQNSTLKIHLKRHHGQGGEDGGSGNLSCEICGREFDDEAPFLQHQQEHPPQATSSVSSSGEASNSGPLSNSVSLSNSGTMSNLGAMSNSAAMSSTEQHSATESDSVQVHSVDEDALPEGRLIIKEM